MNHKYIPNGESQRVTVEGKVCYIDENKLGVILQAHQD